ncbi:Sodium- and chloride-dependent glycine transporter 2 [Nymphon striatum]|nr:Sodium- and chloride-dependent glycine transporter 2 [Nymphon striatum]
MKRGRHQVVADSSDSKETQPERDGWTGKFDFLLSSLGYAVGLGSFLIPYLTMLVLVGIPSMFLEFSIGQFSALASLPLFKNLCPLFTDCFNDADYRECKKDEGIYFNHTCFNGTDSRYMHLNDTPAKLRLTPAVEYFQNFVIGRTSGIEEFGDFNWRIWLCVILSWVIVFLCCIKGVRSSGKVVYFTATFPYVMLLVLLIRGVTLEGAIDGIKFYVTPKWNHLGKITIWQEAAVQIFLSLGVGSGGTITLASYNKFKNNVVRDALIISIGNCLTSIFAGFAVFSVIGYIAGQLGKDVEDVIKGGPGLAFTVYPDAIVLMPISPLWAILFFLMLITLGLDSVFGTVENIVSSVVDEIPRLRSKRVWILFGMCVIGCIIGIPLSLGSGIYFLDLCFAVIGWKNLLNGILEFAVIGYLYGELYCYQIIHETFLLMEYILNIV